MRCFKMNKLRIVIDTNTLISSILIAASVPDQAFKKSRSIGILLFSDATFEELQQVITRPKFDRLCVCLTDTSALNPCQARCPTYDRESM